MLFYGCTSKFSLYFLLMILLACARPRNCRIFVEGNAQFLWSIVCPCGAHLLEVWTVSTVYRKLSCKTLGILTFSCLFAGL